MKKTEERNVVITAELLELIKGKLEKKGLSSYRASIDMNWTRTKLYSILKGYVKYLELDEMDALITYLPIHKSELSEEFWYRYNSEKQKLALKISKERLEARKAEETSKEAVVKLTSEDDVVEITEPKDDGLWERLDTYDTVKAKAEEPLPIVKQEAECVTLVKLLTNDLLNMLDQGGDRETIRSYTSIIIRNLERIRANA